MCRVFSQLLGKVDNLNCIKGAFFDTDAIGFAETDFLGDVDIVGIARLGAWAAFGNTLFPVLLGGQKFAYS